MATVKHGQFVQVHYSGRLKDGTIFDSSEGRQPLEFQAGSSQVIPGFEAAVMSMAIDEEKTINLPADEAYGQLQDDLKRDFPVTMVGEEKIAEGQNLWFRTPQGPVQGKVVAIGHTHPLTAQAIKEMILEIEREGIQLVFASEVVG